MTPYYQDGAVTIYHGDCREIMAQMLPGGAAMTDLVLTDPPYGIGEAAGKNKSRGKLAIARDYGNEDWDAAPPSEWVFGLIRELSKKQVIWGGNYFGLPRSSCWLVWDKDNGESDFADCELAWTNLDKAVRLLKWRWAGMLQEDMKNKEIRVHPTQKPLAVMRWSIIQAGENVSMILDPYMGSGTTLRAAKDLGRKAIGIERSERYCEEAAKRMAQEVMVL